MIALIEAAEEGHYFANQYLEPSVVSSLGLEEMRAVLAEAWHLVHREMARRRKEGIG